MNKNNKSIIIAASIVGALVVIAIIFLVVQNQQTKDAEYQAQIEQLQLQNEQLQLKGEYEQLNTDFQNMESQTQFIRNDSILQKYNEAKDKVEKLLAELRSQKISSQKRIKELQDEVATLKGIMRHYVAIIDSLGKENAGLKAENLEIRTKNQQLSSQVSEQTRKNEKLTERMVLAEKLNVTGLQLTALKKNGKVEKNVTKAKQLMVTFTIPQNNSTPVGEKTLFVRITSPEGTLLGGHGSFSFEGGNLPYTERKTIEYDGQEVAGITLYWNVNTALTPGQYNVEVFADNYRLISRSFTLNK